MTGETCRRPLSRSINNERNQNNDWNQKRRKGCGMKAVPPILHKLRKVARILGTVTVAGEEVIRLAIPVLRVLVMAVGRIRSRS
jgi:hypothetical protein